MICNNTILHDLFDIRSNMTTHYGNAIIERPSFFWKQNHAKKVYVVVYLQRKVVKMPIKLQIFVSLVSLLT